MVKIALRWRSHFGRFLGNFFAPKFARFFNHFYTFVLPLFRKVLKLILEPSLGSERPKRAKMSPKEPSGASKNQKPSFTKTLKNPLVFSRFLATEASQESLKRPKMAPKRHQKIKDPKNRNPKLIPKIITKIGTYFGAHSETQAQPKKNREKIVFGTPFPRISGVQIMPRQKINERGKKASLTEIILYKRKGGIRPYKASDGRISPYKAL